MRGRSMRRLYLALAVVLAVTPALWPQTTVGQIAGKVFDSTGAVVPRCSVKATNQATGLVFAAETDDNGFYAFPSLPPGQYDVAAEAKGFRSLVHSGGIL